MPGWIPLALAALIVLVELPTLRRRRPEAERRDRGTKALVIALSTAGYFGAFFVAGLLQGRLALPGWLAWAGVAIAIFGTGFRLWAIRTLGRYFTTAVQVSSDQPVIDRGPYRVLRHPSYAGGWLAGVGVGLSLGNLASLLLIALPQLAAFLVRIAIEERALLSTLGEPYRAYAERTWRLIPFVY